MTTIFEHTVIPQNSPTSPVENLATEVSAGFDQVSAILSAPTNILPNYAKVIGNFLLTGIKKHGFTKTYVEAVTLQVGVQSFSLQAIPTSVTSLSYYDSIAAETVYLSAIPAGQSFTAANQYTVIGKTVHISGAKSTSVTFQTSYNGLVPLLGNLTGYSNILTNTSGTYLVAPSIIGTALTLTYDFDVQAKVSELFRQGLNADYIYVIGKTIDDEYRVLNYSSFNITTNSVIFSTTDDTSDIDTVAIYTLNIDISELLTNLYTDYVNHNHSSDEIMPAINHDDLLNLYSDSDKLLYKKPSVVGYQHPQFLNRSGYDATLPEVYNNGMIGDLFISAMITSTDQNYKTLLKDSYAITFGSPTVGTSIYFDTLQESLTIRAGAGLKGLNISHDPAYAGLSLNGVASIGEATIGSTFKGKDQIVDIISDAMGIDSELHTDVLIAREASQFLGGLTSTRITLGTVALVPVGNVLEVRSTTTVNPTESVSFTLPVTAEKVTVDTLIPSTYKFQDGFVIEVTPTDTLNSIDGQFRFDTTKSVDFKSNGRGTGLKVGRDSDNSFEIYNAGFAGQPSFGNDSAFYVEVPTGQTTYLLQSTTNPIIKDGISYCFGTPVTDSTLIGSLKDWLKSDIVAGDISGYSLHADASDSTTRNGVTIGAYTRISTVGSGTDCPEGLTILESRGDFAFVNPLSSTATACTGVIYQNVNMGNTQIFGKLAVDASVFAIGNITSGDTLISRSADIAGDLKTSTMLVTESAVFNGPVELLNTVTMGSTLNVTGGINVAGSVTADSLVVNKSVNVDGMLSVAGQTIFESNVTVDGAIYTVSGFTTTGPVIAESLKVGPISCGNISGDGGLTINGQTVLSGPISFQGNIEIQGNTKQNGSLQVSQDVTAKTLYTIDSATINGTLTATDSVVFTGNSISLGTEESVVQINGALQLNNPLTTVTGDLRVFGAFSTYKPAIFGDSVVVKGTATVTSLKVDAGVTIGGTLTADSATFARKVYLSDGLQASGISTLTTATITDLTATTVTTDELNVSTSLNMGASSTLQTHIVKVDQIIQTDPSENSSFVGSVTFNNDVAFKNNLIIGDENITHTRDTAGILINSSTIKMGVNSTIAANKIFTGKGIPYGGDIDVAGGFAFQTANGISASDGDTGLFASIGSGAGTFGSDLHMYIDGNVKGTFFHDYPPANIPIDLDDPTEMALRGDAVMTLAMLKNALIGLQTQIDNAGASAIRASWPVGSIYSNGLNGGNPGDVGGVFYGVAGMAWVPYAAGRTLVGMTSAAFNGTVSAGLIPPSDFATGVMGAIYGEYKHSLTAEENGPHTHTVRGHADGSSKHRDGNGARDSLNETSSSGLGTPHNNVQPSVITAMWMRIA